MNSKDRVILFIDSQNVSRRKFSEKIGVSHLYFSTKSAISADVLEKIFSCHPELNMDWVITGRGEMLYREPEFANEWKEKYYQLLDLKFTVVTPEETKKTYDVDAAGNRNELTIAAEPEIPITKTKK